MDNRIHVINLAQRPDRRDSAGYQLQTQGLRGCFWPGIIVPDDSKKGIAQAHKQLIRFALAEGLPSITVAEDDLLFTAPGAWEFFTAHEPDHYDLYLASIYYGKIHPDKSITDFAGLTLYSIRACFYETFLGADEAQDIDRALAGKGSFIVCDPFIAIQQNGHSDNRDAYTNNEVYMAGRELFKGKRAK